MLLSEEGRFVADHRYTLLVPKFASLYPELPANRWMPAWDAAMRRAQQVWREAGPEALVYTRLLPEEHFEFRGGQPRPSNWYLKPERLSDPTTAEILPE